MSRGKRSKFVLHTQLPYTNPSPPTHRRTHDAQGITVRMSTQQAASSGLMRNTEEWRHAMKEDERRPIGDSAGSAGLIACHGSPAQWWKGTHLEGRVCVVTCHADRQSGVWRGSGRGGDASSEAQKPSDEKPSEAGSCRLHGDCSPGLRTRRPLLSRCASCQHCD